MKVPKVDKEDIYVVGSKVLHALVEAKAHALEVVTDVVRMQLDAGISALNAARVLEDFCRKPIQDIMTK